MRKRAVPAGRVKTTPAVLLSAPMSVALALGVAIGLSACSADSQPTEPEVQTYTLQHALPNVNEMVDGVLSPEDYEAAYREFLTCMETAGFDVLEQGFDRGIYGFSYASAADESKEGTACVQTFEPIDFQMQYQQRDLNATTDLIRECLRARGVEPAATRDEMDVQFDELKMDILVCAEEQGAL